MLQKTIQPKHLSILGLAVMVIFFGLLQLQATNLELTLFGLVLEAMTPSSLETSESSSAILKLLPCFAGLLMLIHGTRKTIEAKKEAE